MKKKIDKGISALGTVLFVGLIQTDAPAWTLVVLALMVYEIAQWCCRIARRQARMERRRRYVTVNKTNARRWSETRIGWPMKEVS